MSYKKTNVQISECDDGAKGLLNMRLGMSAKEFAREHVKDIEGDFTVSINQDTKEALALAISADGPIQFTRYYDIQNKFAIAAQASTQHQGRSLFKTFFGNQLTVCEMLDLEKITISANEIGQYAWLRYGYLPDENSWRHLQPQLKDNLDALKDHIDPKTYNKVRAAIGLNSPKAAWYVADQRDDIDGFPLGFLLFRPLGCYWGGEFNLKDPEALRRCQKYIQPKAQMVA